MGRLGGWVWKMILMSHESWCTSLMHLSFFLCWQLCKLQWCQQETCRASLRRHWTAMGIYGSESAVSDGPLCCTYSCKGWSPYPTWDWQCYSFTYFTPEVPGFWGLPPSWYHGFMGEFLVSSAGTGRACLFSLWVPNPSPVRAKNRAPKDFIQCWTWVWRKVPDASPSANAELDLRDPARLLKRGFRASGPKKRRN